MTHLVSPLELLLINPSEQNDDHKITSIGIGTLSKHTSTYYTHRLLPGDGGNEVGMGKMYERILNSSVPNASLIACTVSTDHLIVA